ncbi:MAG: nitrophenyl compound nitroreductase subunit ArsF family protein [candidate division Zixibacteria bacterium]
MKKILICLLGFILLAFSAVVSDDQQPAKSKDTTITSEEKSDADKSQKQIVVYYLHGNKRCATCKKIEAYSEEAIKSGFSENLKDSSIVWQTVNFEDEGNEHYVKDYQLYTKSLILSRKNDGKEVEWKNLTEIWTLVRDKEKFIGYVQTELGDFIKVSKK